MMGKYNELAKLIISSNKSRVNGPQEAQNDVATPRQTRPNGSIPSNSATLKRSNLTYAQALSKATISAAAIKTINVVIENEKEVDALIKQLRADGCCSDSNITSIKSKGPRSITFKCADAESANKVETELMTKYTDAIQITTSVTAT